MSKKDITFYHGTSTALKIKRYILPSDQTGCLREEFRKKMRDRVFLTNSLVSAQKYARKAAEKYGGEPVVYEAKPVGYISQVNKTEFVCETARKVSEIVL